MRHVRDLAIWLGAPLLASLLCTLGWTVIAGGKMVWSITADGTMANLRVAVSMGMASVLFTIGGSTVLSLMFAGLSALPTVNRYFILVGFGAIAGGFLMLFLGAPPVGITAGAIYGVVTACFWVGLHSAVHRSRQIR